MSLETNQIASWADIQALYNAMNSAREQFSLATVTVPGNPGIMVNTSISSLNDQVNAMSSNKFLTNIAVTGVTVTPRGELIAVAPFTRISNTITTIQNTCAFDSFTFYTGNNGFQSFGFDSFNNSYRAFSYRTGRGCNFRSHNASRRS